MLIYDVFHSISLKCRDESHFYPVLDYSVILKELITTYSGSLYFPVLRSQNFIQKILLSLCNISTGRVIAEVLYCQCPKISEILGL